MLSFLERTEDQSWSYVQGLILGHVNNTPEEFQILNFTRIHTLMAFNVLFSNAYITETIR